MPKIAQTVEEMLLEDDSKVEETQPESILEPDDEVVETTPVVETKPEEPKVEEKAEEKVEEPAADTISSDETPEPTQDVVVEPAQPEKLFAGKYKNVEELEKAYLESQSALTKKSQAVSEKVKEAESMIDEREFEAMVDTEIGDKAINIINKTYATITDQEVQKTAAQYLMSFNTTGDSRYMEAYFNCLDRSVERQLQRQLAQIDMETRQSFASRRSEIIYEPAKKELLQIESEDPEFIKENADILVQVIKSNPKTSVKEIRSLIKQVESRAVEKYKKTLIAQPKIEKSVIIPATKAPAPRPEDKPKKPEYAMSVAEMLATA